MGYKNKATIHGFRGVASTVLNESSKFSVDVIERQLSHVEVTQQDGLITMLIPARKNQHDAMVGGLSG